MRYLRDHDPLTGLPNRQAFSDSLADALPTMNRNRKHIAVLCLDVDKFKDINDASDIATGDA
ncbi:MAG: GGDEF domain-containing protein, partial [Methyloceanibacter sp.]